MNERGAEPGEQANCFRRTGGVDQVSSRANCNVVPAERRSKLMRRRGTAGEAEQGCVVHVVSPLPVDARSPHELGCQ